MNKESRKFVLGLFLASFLFFILYSSPVFAEYVKCYTQTRDISGQNLEITQACIDKNETAGESCETFFYVDSNCTQPFLADPSTEGAPAGSAVIGQDDLPPLYDPLAGKDAPTVVGGLIQTVLSIVGSLALVIFVYAGIMWMTSAGNEEKALHAAKMMTWAALGLVVIFSSYIVLQFVFRVVAGT